jgi:hypothetical protein
MIAMSQDQNKSSDGKIAMKMISGSSDKTLTLINLDESTSAARGKS